MLSAIEYAPLLRTKPAEINAFQYLADHQKSAIFPIFMAKPWQNAISFNKTIEKVQEATKNIPFAFGLDREFMGGTARQPAQREFDTLFDPSNGFKAYYDCIEDIENAVPIFLGGGSVDQILLQLGRADSIGRGLIVHFRRNETAPVLNLTSSVPPLPEDTVFLVDAGWSRDHLLLQQWTLSTVNRILAVLPNAEIIVMSSTFPDSFSSIIGQGEVALFEPTIFNAVRAVNNNARLIYGDWATTRPPQSGGGGEIPPRIDIPTKGGCRVFRANLEAAQTYADMATLAIAHSSFKNLADCYGKELIAATPSGSGIKGTQRATEARINIHLVQNAGSSSIAAAEEAYSD